MGPGMPPDVAVGAGGTPGQLNQIEILVVSLDPVQRGGQPFVVTVRIGDDSDANPERHLRMPLQDTAGRPKITVNVAERTELHPWRGKGEGSRDTLDPLLFTLSSSAQALTG